jgi:hypothetical protein
MVDNARAAQWSKDAKILLARCYGQDEALAHMAIVVLALLEDRDQWERYCSRLSPLANPLELATGE